jgi:DNA-binding transcriptional regulator YhcF (GntR family)
MVKRAASLFSIDVISPDADRRPAHGRVLDRIQRAISSGALPRNARLPSSSTLARDLGLSRNTVDEALSRLVAEGFVVRRRGIGSFVSSSLPENPGVKSEAAKGEIMVAGMTAPKWFAAILSFFAAAAPLCAADLGSAPFEYFVGHWDCAGHFAANGAAIKSSIAFAWQESTQTLHVQHDDLAPNPYHAVELWGQSKAAKEYRNTIGDSYSGIRWLTSPGWTGDSLSWTRLDKGKPAEKFTYNRKNASQMTVEWFVAKPSGEFVLSDSLNCARTPS